VPTTSKLLNLNQKGFIFMMFVLYELQREQRGSTAT
jgi:hypothetical protein